MLMNANGGDAKVRTKLHSMETLTIMKKTPILTLYSAFCTKQALTAIRPDGLPRLQLSFRTACSTLLTSGGEESLDRRIDTSVQIFLQIRCFNR